LRIARRIALVATPMFVGFLRNFAIDESSGL
jgi:hypothetical protein